MTLQLAETSKHLEYVKREFQRMRDDLAGELDDVRDELENRFDDDGDLPKTLEEYLGDEGELQSHLDDAFGEDGEFVDRLDAELGEDSGRIQAALDPDVEGTPTYRLKSELRDDIQKLNDKIVEEETREQEAQKDWRKGESFEATVGNLLEDIVYQTTHQAQNTGDEEGSLPGRDIGDHVLTLAETGQRIVFESKSEKNYTEPKIRSEMAEAMENRDADYGVFVTECESYVPNKVGYFQEWDNEVLSVALCHDEDDEIDPGFLRIAFNWAKMRALQDHVDAETSVDPETIRAQTESVRDSIDRFSDAKRK